MKTNLLNLLALFLFLGVSGCQKNQDTAEPLNTINPEPPVQTVAPRIPTDLPKDMNAEQLRVGDQVCVRDIELKYRHILAGMRFPLLVLDQVFYQSRIPNRDTWGLDGNTVFVEQLLNEKTLTIREYEEISFYHSSTIAWWSLGSGFSGGNLEGCYSVDRVYPLIRLANNGVYVSIATSAGGHYDLLGTDLVFPDLSINIRGDINQTVTLEDISNAFGGQVYFRR